MPAAYELYRPADAIAGPTNLETLRERIRELLPCRWAVRLAVTGDLRFSSHKDMMRVLERTALRAGVPLAYSQGFNPHPLLSLTCPRPVGVASLDDLLVVSVEEPGPASGEALAAALNAHGPRGLSFRDAAPLPRGVSPQPQLIRYVMPLSADQARQLAPALERLAQADAWPVERAEKGRSNRDRDGRSSAVRTINLKPLVAGLALEGEELVFSLHSGGGQSARPAEVLTLLGLPEQAASRLVRTAVEVSPPAR